ncbi:MAG: phosphoenolpyruvate carboxykinase (ATP) [Anaerolineales bacterium]|nr:phosphoenolpyruvate carboxykinase (ATP) [Anaerolineae bacterium]PWB52982.1 MAG: phosphoenolpyruvate carboxykinase (ATP) [Anaerolineales bacterium]
MNNILNIKTPAEGQAEANKSDFGLDNIALLNLRKVYWNLTTEALYEEIIFRGEAQISHMGPVIVNTGKHTARAASDKFVVRESTTEQNVWWGEYNRPYATPKFDELYNRLQGFLQGRDLFVQDCYGGADPNYRLPVRIITESAWHSLFARNMFIKPKTNEEYRRHVPEFTVISVPSFKAFPQIDGTPSNTFIVINFEQRLCIIGNTGYGGEIKKSVFTLLNYLLPMQGIMTMHCSANIGKNGDTALFFGLSGTGKTTLSADPNRGLIGDDEHGWSDEGIFNFEDGCYAKVIGLSPTAEPEIYACTRRFGTILENVVYDPVTRYVDLDDDTRTENTRASYPLDFIGNAIPEKMGGHPKNIIFLTCDASGVMPPIARLTPDQALYHFISGYTAKVGGTEIGLGEEPEITFSACFGAPFMVLPPAFYANLLKQKILRYGVDCWLVNTGWVGGPYGVGKRISIRYTRDLLNSALNGELKDVEYYTDPVFGFQVPKHCPGIPDNVLYPATSWPSEDAYMKRYTSLAARFIDNFKKFADDCPPEVVKSGPTI